MSVLVNFYRGESRNAEGRFLEEILMWDDDEMEEVDNFVQWLLPLSGPYQISSDTPLLDEMDIAKFPADPVLRWQLAKVVQAYPFLSGTGNRKWQGR